ncbi:DNA polymerase [Secundilactobacillus kimchicus]|uniref:DNA polymerase n=1 Tax=Secundilactobacillus kimchicus TaxID=528209 RepID=UPI0020787ACD|nr:DNA polymerase [Secundilactobacillus kimchicus]
MVVLDYLRPSYADNEGNFIFWNTRAGKLLNKTITAPRAGLGLDLKEVSVTFAYPKVPPIKANNKLAKVTKKLGSEYFDKLQEVAVKQEPDLILTFGNTALLGISGREGVDSRRGQPFQMSILSNEREIKPWVIPLYGLENVLMDTVKEGLFRKDLQLVKDFLEKGPKVLTEGIGDYEFIRDFDRVKEVFDDILVKKKYPIIAFDTETNTLHGQYQNVPDKNGTGKIDSARPLMLSMSWEEGQGVAFLLDHKESTWTPEQLSQIYGWVKELLMSDQWKVLANGKFDIRFLKQTIGLTHTKHCLDIQVMYYIAVTEEKNVRKSLKVLAVQYTNMGGYEEPLNKFKEQFLIDHHEAWIQKMDARKEATGEKYYKKDYKPLVNEIDGSDFNYEWIPLEIIEPYAAADTDATLRIYNVLKNMIGENPKWANLVMDFYPRLQDALAEMEANGLYIDTDYADNLLRVYSDRRNRIVKEIQETVPEVHEFEESRLNQVLAYRAEMKKPKDERDEFVISEGRKLSGKDKSTDLPKYRYKPSSSQQNKYLLYYVLGYTLPYDRDYLTKKTVEDKVPESEITWENYKTDQGALEYLVNTYEDKFAKLLLDYTVVNKALNSFIEKLPPLVDPKGTVHTTFNMLGTVTGRLSSSGDFNAQQLPRRIATPGKFGYNEPVKRMIKSRFDGGVILNIDFKTLEVYIAALLSGDPKMAQILLNGGDFHSQNARNMWHIPESEPVPKDLRSKAKAATFG